MNPDDLKDLVERAAQGANTLWQDQFVADAVRRLPGTVRPIRSADIKILKRIAALRRGE